MLSAHPLLSSGAAQRPAKFFLEVHTKNIHWLRSSRRRHKNILSSPAALSAPLTTTKLAKAKGPKHAADTILECLSGVQGRGKSGLDICQLEVLNAAVDELERDGGIQAPTTSPLLEGRWKLLYTSRPGTASPIQQTFVGVQAFSVYQEIVVRESSVRVNNIVSFGDKIGQLKVEAEANTDSRPLLGFTPRKGKGLPIFGKSKTDPPVKKDMRIDFQFDRAAFDFKFLPFKVPYPVPFKLLGDETKGWIDITYLSPNGDFRLSRGNKGTLFILTRDIPAKQRLIAAVQNGADDAEVMRLLDEVVSSGGGERKPALSPRAPGRWRLQWSAQAKDANPLQKALANRVGNYQLLEDEAGPGALQNVVEVTPFLKVRAGAECEPDRTASGLDRTTVRINYARVEVFSIRIPLPFNAVAPGYIEWLYLDEELRITKGNKGSYFIHTRY
ncbi:probable plastid-lipid-associated protein 12, chloroplasti [Coccomyxa sp. Obi]|nr:probable plastid-lipid-associated protein 12, chloroplasti [Coccomyxa sp. Obi]